MRTNLLIPIGLFFGGIALVALAVLTGEADVSLILVIPVFSGSSALFLLGVLLVIASFMVGFAMVAFGQGEAGICQSPTDQSLPEIAGTRRAEYGGVILIGPVPIAFGSNKNIALVMLVIGVVTGVLILGLLLAF